MKNLVYEFQQEIVTELYKYDDADLDYLADEISCIGTDLEQLDFVMCEIDFLESKHLRQFKHAVMVASNPKIETA